MVLPLTKPRCCLLEGALDCNDHHQGLEYSLATPTVVTATVGTVLGELTELSPPTRKSTRKARNEHILMMNRAISSKVLLREGTTRELLDMSTMSAHGKSKGAPSNGYSKTKKKSLKCWIIMSDDDLCSLSILLRPQPRPLLAIECF